jgi:hypothetical protein
LNGNRDQFSELSGATGIDYPDLQRELERENLEKLEDVWEELPYKPTINKRLPMTEQDGQLTLPFTSYIVVALETDKVLKQAERRNSNPNNVQDSLEDHVQHANQVQAWINVHAQSDNNMESEMEMDWEPGEGSNTIEEADDDEDNEVYEDEDDEGIEDGDEEDEDDEEDEEEIIVLDGTDDAGQRYRNLGNRLWAEDAVCFDYYKLKKPCP